MRLLVVCAALAFASSAAAQENVFPRMVGKWREMNTATTVVIEADGTVFANGSPIYGQVQRTITSGGNFAFENQKAQCVYDIVLVQDDTTASWGLRSETLNDPTVAKGFCLPKGHFVRIETPAEAESRRLETAQKERNRLARIEAARLEAIRLDRERQERLESQRIEALRAERERQEKIEAERIDRERKAEFARKDAERERYVKVAGECDRLAANPNDKGRPSDVTGMPWADLKLYARDAVKACIVALQTFIDHPRLVYQLARAMQFVDGPRALKLYNEAAWKLGYPAAYDNLGSMYRDGKYVPKDLEKALAMFRKGAQLGDVDAMYSLAEMLLRAQPNNIHPEGYEWLKRAAASGHDGAVRAVEVYELTTQRQREQQQYGQQQGQIMINMFGQMLRHMR